MSKLNDLAVKTATNYGGESAALDPASIGAFIEILIGIVSLFQGCKQTPAQAVASARNPGLFQRLRLRNHLRNSMSTRDWRVHGEAILDAVYKTGQNTSTADWEALYQEV